MKHVAVLGRKLGTALAVTLARKGLLVNPVLKTEQVDEINTLRENVIFTEWFCLIISKPLQILKKP